MKLFTVALALWILEAVPSAAQTVLREHIWSTVVYNRYGDRTPYVLPTSDTLTPLGATQMYNAGARFRDRYLVSTAGNSSTVIQGISQFQLNNDQVSISSLTEQFVVASAQAFMQGLYPPLQHRPMPLSSMGNLSWPMDPTSYPLWRGTNTHR